MDGIGSPKLLDQVRARIRLRHYSASTEEAYVRWIRRFILFHGKRHPRDMGALEVERFLSYLAVEQKISSSTQNQGKAALLFLYKEVLELNLPWLNGIVQAKSMPRTPVVLTEEEVARMLGAMKGTMGLVARFLYGTGLRLMEGLSLRVKDLELGRHEVVVREGKGAKDRVTVLPDCLVEAFQFHLIRVGYASTFEQYTILTVINGIQTGIKSFSAKEFTEYRKSQFAAYKKTPKYKLELAQALKEGGNEEDIEGFLFEFSSEYYLSQDFNKPAN